MTLTKSQKRRLAQQRNQQIKGQGDFKIPGFVKKIAKEVKNEIMSNKGLAKKALVGAGGFVGQRLGSRKLGTKAGALASKIVGMGDYEIVANSLVTDQGTFTPTFAPDGRRGIRIREREYIGDVRSGDLLNGASVFTNADYVINPSNQSTFPWLSQIANNFEQWEPNGIVFEYRSTSSNFNGSSQALGVVVMATEYNMADPNYATKQEMENSAYAMSAKASEGLLHGVECDPKERPTKLLYTGNGVGSDTSENLHNLGRFQIATQGMAEAGVNIGELWITYDITFYKKQVTEENLAFTSFAYPDGLSQPQNVEFLRDASAANVYGKLGVTHNELTNKFVFPKGATGRYRISVHYVKTNDFSTGQLFLGLSGAGSDGIIMVNDVIGITDGTAGNRPHHVWFCEVDLEPGFIQPYVGFDIFQGTTTNVLNQCIVNFTKIATANIAVT